MRRRSAVVQVEARVVVVSGWKTGSVLHDAGLRAIYAGSSRGWMIDRHRLPDVLAVLDHNGYSVRIRESA